MTILTASGLTFFGAAFSVAQLPEVSPTPSDDIVIVIPTYTPVPPTPIPLPASDEGVPTVTPIPSPSPAAATATPGVIDLPVVPIEVFPTAVLPMPSPVQTTEPPVLPTVPFGLVVLPTVVPQPTPFLPRDASLPRGVRVEGIVCEQEPDVAICGEGAKGLGGITVLYFSPERQLQSIQTDDQGRFVITASENSLLSIVPPANYIGDVVKPVAPRVSFALARVQPQVQDQQDRFVPVPIPQLGVQTGFPTALLGVLIALTLVILRYARRLTYLTTTLLYVQYRLAFQPQDGDESNAFAQLKQLLVLADVHIPRDSSLNLIFVAQESPVIALVGEGELIIGERRTVKEVVKSRRERKESWRIRTFPSSLFLALNHVANAILAARGSKVRVAYEEWVYAIRKK